MSSGLAPSWLDASLGRPPSKPKQTATSSRTPAVSSTTARDVSQQPAAPPPRTGPYRPPMMGSRPPGQTQLRREPPAGTQKPNSFDTQFPTLGVTSQQKGAPTTAWGATRPASNGPSGLASGNKTAAVAKPKLKMVNQSVAKVSRSRPAVIAQPAKAQSNSSNEATGLQAPIRGSLHTRAAPSTSPQQGLKVSSGPPSSQSSNNNPPLSDKSMGAAGSFQPSAAQTSLARKIVKQRKQGGRSITDVAFINDIINPAANVDDKSGPGVHDGGSSTTSNTQNNGKNGENGDFMAPDSWETEERLLRQMGWTDGMNFDDDVDEGEGLTEEEINAFKEFQVSSGSHPVQRPTAIEVAPSLANVLAPPAWMTNPPNPVDDSDESSDDELG